MRTVLLTGQPMANISDHLTMVNLAPFGRCRSLGFPATAAATAAHHGHLTPMPCMHNTPFPWMGGKMDYIVKGDPALLKSCTCQCMWGGTISLITDGQVGEGTQWVQKKPKTTFDIPGLGLEEYQGEVSNLTLSPGGTPKTQSHSKGNKLLDILSRYEIKEQAWITSKASKLNPNGINSSAIAEAAHILDVVKSKRKKMTDNEADDIKSNPNVNKSRKFRTNCATTTPTFFMRKQGYHVIAKGRTENKHVDELAKTPFILYQDKNGNDAKATDIMSIYKEKLTKNNIDAFQNKNYKKKTKEQIYKETLLQACKEDGYYAFALSWKPTREVMKDENGNPLKDKNGNVIYKRDKNGKIIKKSIKHVTVIKSEKGLNGEIKLVHIEPQTGNASPNIDALVSKLAPPEKSNGVLRVLDKTGDPVVNVKENYYDIFAIEK